MWNLSYGEDYEWFRERFEAGEDVAQLESKPEVSDVIHYRLWLWNRVAPSRPPGFSNTPAVPITEFETAYRVYSVHEFCPLEEFVEWMNFLDAVARGYFDELSKQKTEREKKPLIVPATH